jgi:hypothetical protein
MMVGPSGAGKSTLIGKHFNSREVISLDALRVEFTGDVRRQDRNDEVLNEVYRRVEVKTSIGQRVVIDATHLRDKDRRRSYELGLMLDIPVTYLVVNRSVESKLQTAGWRKEIFSQKRGLGLIEWHEQTFQANEAKILLGDSQKGINVIDTRVDEFEVIQELSRENLSEDLQSRGFTKVRVIADVHGNLDSYRKAIDVSDDTFLIFLGDLLDYDVRGIEIVERTYRLIQRGRAISIRGNHEKKIANWVVRERGEGFEGNISHGNDFTVNVVKAMTPARRAAWEAKFLALVDLSPDWIALGRYLFVHGAAHHSIWGDTLFRADRNSKREAMAMYGETTGEYVNGFPERLYNWVDDVPARHIAVVGHAVLSTDGPLTKENDNGGKAIFLDTGSSKEIDVVDGEKLIPPVRGHLSWMDLTLTKGNVLFDAFGRD